MKRFKKLFLMCAAVSAVAAVSCTAAMAAGELQPTYADGTVTIGSYDSTGDQQTLLILNKDATTVEDSMIVQIDQETAFDTVTVGDLADGTYYVRIGGSNGNSYLSGTFTVGDVSTRLLGDVDGNNAIEGPDAAAVAQHVVGLQTLTGDSLQAADADDNGAVEGPDASEIARFVVDLSSNVDGSKTIGSKTNPVPEG